MLFVTLIKIAGALGALGSETGRSSIGFPSSLFSLLALVAVAE
jgi:hypothetical protein